MSFDVHKKKIKALGHGGKIVCYDTRIRSEILTIVRFGLKRVAVVTESGVKWRLPYATLTPLTEAVLAKAEGKAKVGV
jgi:hypothetical protein